MENSNLGLVILGQLIASMETIAATVERVNLATASGIQTASKARAVQVDGLERVHLSLMRLAGVPAAADDMKVALRSAAECVDAVKRGCEIEITGASEIERSLRESTALIWQQVATFKSSLQEMERTIQGAASA